MNCIEYGTNIKDIMLFDNIDKRKAEKCDSIFGLGADSLRTLGNPRTRKLKPGLGLHKFKRLCQNLHRYANA